jgi:hypothetical protein
LICVIVAAAPPGAADTPFVIKVVDDQTGRGVPLIELRTVHEVKFVTDSNGIVAFSEPGLMGQDVFFHVSGHGYEFPADGFGQRGKAFHATSGRTATLTVRRINIAERLYRVTGGGVYRDSVLAGVPVPLKDPVLSAQVLGSDSVLTAVYRGKLYWFWGDTSRLRYPLGNFHVSGATSDLPGRGGLNPDRGVDLSYIRDDNGFAREMAHMPGDGPTWLVGLAVLADASGRDRLNAGYVKVKPPLTVYARGLAVFDDDTRRFEHVTAVDLAAAAFPSGHSFRHIDGGVEYVYFGNPFPVTRVRIGPGAFARTAEYECYSPLVTGSRLDAPKLDRDDAGRLRYAWRNDTPAVGTAEEARLLAAGQLKRDEVRWRLRDRASGKPVMPHSGSVNWNEYRHCWILIAVESGGTSSLGEVWYAEADAPTGPWGDAVKIVTHDSYSFYNPTQHPEFDRDGGRIIYFEGTYSRSFSGNPNPTPRYDYNQIMYRLDLADSRLSPPKGP